MELTQETKNKILIASRNNFKFFTNNVFCHSTAILKNNKFTGGEYVDSTCDYLQNSLKTARISARDHFKSMSFYAHILWKLLHYVNRSLEIHYFSYNAKMASYHTEKIKKAILSNPFFDDLKDYKKSAESILKFSWDGEHFITLEPHGLLEFNRGIHCPLLYVDDPFQDPANKLNITLIKKINNIIATQILDMSWREIHIAGTPQTNQDFFFDEDTLHDFNVRVQPAVVSDAKKIALWPEWKDYDALMAIKRNKGQRIFNQEYLCRPAYSEDSYLDKAELEAVINPKLINYTPEMWKKEIERRKKAGEEYKNDMFGGYDIGKKRHPAHLTLFEIVNGKSIQRRSKFYDNVKYVDQLKDLKEHIKAFGVDYLWYDDTRGEFQTFEEAGTLPGEMIPINFTRKRKFAMATAMDKSIGGNNIEFIDDDRQKEQMLVVDSDLQALETPEGHGEPFFSNSLRFAEVAEDEEEDEEEEKEEEKQDKTEEKTVRELRDEYFEAQDDIDF